MYVGRIVAIGMSQEGENIAMYRVSSRSFPNREARKIGDAISIMPKPGFEDDINKNPYIAYNCAKIVGDYAVTTNGSHTDPIVEKLASGMSVRDALAVSLMVMDYEKDDYNTPRIAAVVSRTKPIGFLGIVTKDSIIVREFNLKPGCAYYVATYEHTIPSIHYMDNAFSASTAEEAAQYVINGGVFADLENAVTGVAILANKDEVNTAIKEA